MQTSPLSADTQNPFEAFIDMLADKIVERVQAKLQTVAVRPRLYSVEQAAIYLGRSEKAVRELYKNGKLPFIKPDGRVQFDVRDLDKWIEGHSV